MAEGPVLVLEPHCFGFEHATFNAALLRTVQIAFPESRVIFGAESGHLQQVREVLVRRGIDPAAIELEEWQIPAAHPTAWRRLRDELSWCRPLLARARAQNVRLALLASITSTSLVALKTLMPVSGRTPVMAIPHSCLTAIEDPGPRRPWRWILSMKGALALPSSRRLRLIALGDSIMRHVRAAQPKSRLSDWTVLDLPYLWPEPIEAEPAAGLGKVRFGFFGVVDKGFQLFSDLADEIGPRYPEAEFVLVGFQKGPGPSGGWSRFIRVGGQPLSDLEFRERARQLTYCVWTGAPEHYRLTASASFLDAFADLTPTIALRNPFIEDYFEKLGDIGYLCDNYECIRAAVIDIMAGFPWERYRQQRRNLLQGRGQFSPETLGIRLRRAVEEMV